MTAHGSETSDEYRSLIIDCMRHGECEGPQGLRGQMDVELTCAGRSAMRASAVHLPRPERLVCSPLKRCHTVATELAEQWAIECCIDSDLMEIHFGDWEGRALGELARMEPEALTAFWQDPARATPPGGEPLATFNSRVERAWQRCLTVPESYQLIITHGGVIKTWLAQALKMDMQHAMYLHRLEIAHASVVRLRVDLVPDEAPLVQLLFLGVPQAPMKLPDIV